MAAALNSQTCNLSALDLSRNEISGMLVFRCLAQNRSLTALDLRHNPVTDEQMDRIGSFLLTDKCACKIGYVSVTLPSAGGSEESLQVRCELSLPQRRSCPRRWQCGEACRCHS